MSTADQAYQGQCSSSIGLIGGGGRRCSEDLEFWKRAEKRSRFPLEPSRVGCDLTGARDPDLVPRDIVFAQRRKEASWKLLPGTVMDAPVNCMQLKGRYGNNTTVWPVI